MIQMTYYFGSFSEASTALKKGAGFAIVEKRECYDSVLEGVFGEVISKEGYAVFNEREYIPSCVESIAEKAICKLDMKGSRPALNYFMDLLGGISESFSFSLQDIAISTTTARPPGDPLVSEFRFHLDRGNYTLLHTIEGEEGTHVADLKPELYAKFCDLDKEWRQLIRGKGKGASAKALAIKKALDEMVPRDPLVCVATRQTLILRGTESFVNGEALPTVHRAPDVQGHRLLLSIVNLKPRF